MSKVVAAGVAIVVCVNAIPFISSSLHNSKKKGALSGLPAIPNIFASPIGGAIVDRFGADKCCVVYAALVMVGSALLSLALPLESVALLAAGQVIMGIGKGTLTTAQKVFLKLATDPG